MKKGKDIAIEFPGLYLVHHNLPGKAVEPHHHKEHLLFIPLHGDCKVILEDRELHCAPGRMIYLPSNQRHSFRSSDMQGERIIAMISPTVWTRLKCSKFSARLLPLSQLSKELLFYLLLHPKTKNARALIETLVSTLNESLEAVCVDLDIDHLESIAKDPRIQSVLNLFRNRLEEPLPMTEIAKRSGLSVRSLNRLFLEQLSMTPKQVLSQYRVSKAKELLLAGSSVTGACFSVGYQSLTQFIATFRQLTGQLPSEFSS